MSCQCGTFCENIDAHAFQALHKRQSGQLFVICKGIFLNLFHTFCERQCFYTCIGKRIRSNCQSLDFLIEGDFSQAAAFKKCTGTYYRCACGDVNSFQLRTAREGLIRDFLHSITNIYFRQPRHLRKCTLGN